MHFLWNILIAHLFYHLPALNNTAMDFYFHLLRQIVMSVTRRDPEMMYRALKVDLKACFDGKQMGDGFDIMGSASCCLQSPQLSLRSGRDALGFTSQQRPWMRLKRQSWLVCASCFCSRNDWRLRVNLLHALHRWWYVCFIEKHKSHFRALA